LCAGALGGNRTPYALLRTEALYPVSYEGRSGALGGNRTPDLMVRNHSLYPLSYKRTNVLPTPKV
jgi:hypothetical protein